MDSRWQRLWVMMGLVGLSAVGLGGCMPLTVKQQCDLLYKASQPFDDYRRDANQIMPNAIEKHVKLPKIDPAAPLDRAKLAEIQAQLELVRTKNADILADAAVGHQALAGRMEQMAKQAKDVRASDDQAKRWQEVLVRFYELRGQYHRQSATVLQTAGENGDRRQLSQEQQDIIKANSKLHDQIQDNQANRYREEFYEGFKRHCKIGPGVKLEMPRSK